jgi:hypothetical protein
MRDEKTAAWNAALAEAVDHLGKDDAYKTTLHSGIAIAGAIASAIAAYDAALHAELDAIMSGPNLSDRVTRLEGDLREMTLRAEQAEQALADEKANATALCVNASRRHDELGELRRENDNLQRSTRVAWEQAEKEIHAALGISREQLEVTRVLVHAAVQHCERADCGDPKCGVKLAEAYNAYYADGLPLGPKR